MLDSLIVGDLEENHKTAGVTKQVEVGNLSVRRNGVLTKANLKLPSNRPRAPKYVKAFEKLVAKMADDGFGGEVFRRVDVMIWDLGILLCCGDQGGSVGAQGVHKATFWAISNPYSCGTPKKAGVM